MGEIVEIKHFLISQTTNHNLELGSHAISYNEISMFLNLTNKKMRKLLELSAFNSRKIDVNPSNIGG